MEEKYSDEDSLHKLYQIVHKKLIRYIRQELEPYDFSRGEFPLLFKLIKKGDGKTQTEICEMLYVSKSTTSKMIDSLAEKGYLRKERDQEDRRATRIFLTERKDEVEDIIEEIDEKAEKEMLKGFTEEEEKELKAYLEKILDNLENVC